MYFDANYSSCVSGTVRLELENGAEYQMPVSFLSVVPEALTGEEARKFILDVLDARLSAGARAELLATAGDAHPPFASDAATMQTAEETRIDQLRSTIHWFDLAINALESGDLSIASNLEAAQPETRAFICRVILEDFRAQRKKVDSELGALSDSKWLEYLSTKD